MGAGVVIALPNMATLPRRVRFAVTGRLGTDKYDLLSHHQGDRHRWLTTHRQVHAFIRANAQKAGLRVEKIIEEMDGHAAGRLAGYTLTRLHLIPAGWVSARSIFFMTHARRET